MLDNKSVRLLLILFSLFLLTSCTPEQVNCDENGNYSIVCSDDVAPVINGVKDMSIDIGEFINFRSMITVTDNYDGDVTRETEIIENVDIYTPGIYLVKFKATDSAGNIAIELMYVTVQREVSQTGNLVLNGDFSNGFTGYETYTQDDATANFSVVDDVLQIEILSYVEDVWYAPRLNYPRLHFDQGATYTVSFDAKADDERFIQVQVGELLPAEPWYTDFATDINKWVYLTTEYQTFTFEFTMNKPTNANGSILFELGNLNGSNNITTVYIDNIIIQEIE